MQWTAKLIKHRSENRIAVFFEKNAELIARIKQINGARWSRELVAWHVPDTQENRLRFKLPQAIDFYQMQKVLKPLKILSVGCDPSVTAKIHRKLMEMP